MEAVGAWLDGLGLGRYRQCFEQAGYRTLDACGMLQEDVLGAMQVKKAHVRTIMRNLPQQQQGSNPPAPKAALPGALLGAGRTPSGGNMKIAMPPLGAPGYYYPMYYPPPPPPPARMDFAKRRSSNASDGAPPPLDKMPLEPGRRMRADSLPRLPSVFPPAPLLLANPLGLPQQRPPAKNLAPAPNLLAGPPAPIPPPQAMAPPLADPPPRPGKRPRAGPKSKRRGSRAQPSDSEDDLPIIQTLARPETAGPAHEADPDLDGALDNGSEEVAAKRSRPEDDEE